MSLTATGAHAPLAHSAPVAQRQDPLPFAKHTPVASLLLSAAQHGVPPLHSELVWQATAHALLPALSMMHSAPELQQVASHAWLAGQQLPLTQASPAEQQPLPHGVVHAPAHWPLTHVCPAAQQPEPHGTVQPLFIHWPFTQVCVEAQHAKPHGFGQPPPPPPPPHAARQRTA